MIFLYHLSIIMLGLPYTRKEALPYEKQVERASERKRTYPVPAWSYGGASRQAIYAIESEKYEPSIWLACDIACVFGCPIEEVFLFEESERRARTEKSRRCYYGNPETAV